MVAVIEENEFERLVARFWDWGDWGRDEHCTRLAVDSDGGPRGSRMVRADCW